MTKPKFDPRRFDKAEEVTPAGVLGEPQPLVREVMPGMPYPVHALGPLRASVEAVQAMAQAPVAIPAQSALAVAALALQGHRDVETLGGLRPISLYCLTIAVSGERKSTCDAQLMQAMKNYEREQASNYREIKKAHDFDTAIWRKQHDRALRPPKGGTINRAELEAIGTEPPPPPLPDRLVSEPTYEGLTRLFAQGQPTLGLFSDEGGQFLGVFPCRRTTGRRPSQRLTASGWRFHQADTAGRWRVHSVRAAPERAPHGAADHRLRVAGRSLVG